MKYYCEVDPLVDEDTIREFLGKAEDEAITEAEVYDAQSIIYQDNVEDLHNCLQEWLKRRKNAKQFLITSRDIGWLRLKGTRVVPREALEDDSLSLFRVQGDCRITADIDTHKRAIVVRVYHHDAPTGETYTVERKG